MTFCFLLFNLGTSSFEFIYIGIFAVESMYLLDVMRNLRNDRMELHYLPWFHSDLCMVFDEINEYCCASVGG